MVNLKGRLARLEDKLSPTPPLPEIVFHTIILVAPDDARRGHWEEPSENTRYPIITFYAATEPEFEALRAQHALARLERTSGIEPSVSE